MMDRILALDYGDARIGVAVTDPLGMTAQPAGMIRHVGYGPDIRNLEKIADTYQTRRVVMGLPFNMDGTEGFQAQKVRAFAEGKEAACDCFPQGQKLQFRLQVSVISM